MTVKADEAVGAVGAVGAAAEELGDEEVERTPEEQAYDRSLEGKAPYPLRQAEELTPGEVGELIGLTSSGDPEVLKRLAGAIWAVYCAPEPATLASIARDQGVTVERIRQIVARSLGLMRHPSKRKRLARRVAGDTRLWHALMHGCG